MAQMLRTCPLDEVKKLGLHLSADAQMPVIDPANRDRRLARGDEYVAAIVGELAARWQYGKMGAVAGGSSAVAAEADGL